MGRGHHRAKSVSALLFCIISNFALIKFFASVKVQRISVIGYQSVRSITMLFIVIIIILLGCFVGVDGIDVRTTNSSPTVVEIINNNDNRTSRRLWTAYQDTFSPFNLQSECQELYRYNEKPRPIDRNEKNKYKLWPGLMSKADLESGEVLFGMYEVNCQHIIYLVI